MILTIGYEGRAAEEVVALLAGAGATHLADVRLTPLSHKRGLSKRGLAAALAEVGIEYLHLPALGNPKENRDAFRAGEQAAFDALVARLRSPEGAEAVATLAGLAAEGNVALLCFERDVERCHRRFVCAEVLRAARVPVEHL